MVKADKYTFSKIEYEVVVLHSLHEFINSMVNHSILKVVGSGQDCNVIFQDQSAMQLFSIHFVDFLSKTDSKAPCQERTFIEAAFHICSNPCFDINGSVSFLSGVVGAFNDWLNVIVDVDVWFPSIELDRQLKMNRWEFLIICGNISKHNAMRSWRIAHKLQTVLARNGVNINLENSLIALGDFYERFHRDIFEYHASTIAEFLNNIRLGIHEYLRSEYFRAYHDKGYDDVLHLQRYGFDIPQNINSDLAKHCYFELMQAIRSGPYVPKFVVTKWLKRRY